MSDRGPDFNLVMPFVVVESNGGPYNDEAFVDGYTAGIIDATLRNLVPISGEVRWYVSPKLIPQLDLLAMHYGYKMTTELWDEHPDEWALVTFAKPDGGQGGDAE